MTSVIAPSACLAGVRIFQHLSRSPVTLDYVKTCLQQRMKGTRHAQSLKPSDFFAFLHHITTTGTNKALIYYKQVVRSSQEQITVKSTLI
jgi:hypothetical protein